jgi:hypothetical protein
MRTVALWAAVCWAAWLSHNAQAAIGLLENHVNGVCVVCCVCAPAGMWYQCAFNAYVVHCVYSVCWCSFVCGGEVAVWV